MNMKHINRRHSRLQGGFSLIELMIALIIGLLVVAAAGGLFLSNRRVYAATESVNRIQEGQRAAFEMMARDIREAGGNPCTRNVVNMLDTSRPTGAYWTRWMQGLSGTEGGANPDEIVLNLANSSSVRVTNADNPSANIGISTQGGIQDNDIVMVCNPEVASIFQVTEVTSAGGLSLQHNSGSGNPGNLQKPFQQDQSTFDSNPSGNAAGYCFLPDPVNPNSNCLNRASNLPAQVVRPYAVRWFIADNARNGRSLYRQVVINSVAGASDEIAEGVVDMQVQYKLGPAVAMVNASGTWTDVQWRSINAVRVALTFEAQTGALSERDVQGTDNAALTRTFGDVVTLRNRVDIQ